ncbi:MAG: nucleoside monophosphate kinase [Myxococcota bacterium]|nr:nucleoside monophosphate kinase [Myxococcota bacterium]
MDVILHGPPGAGKGTQSRNICTQLGIVAISTGDLIRAEIKQGTELGKSIKRYSSLGKLVPDEVVMQILEKRLKQDDVSNGVLFDGFPRTANQAKMLKEWLAKRDRAVDAVFSLEITDEESMFRCTYRLSTEDGKENYHIYYHKLRVLARSETDKTPIFSSPNGARLVMRDDALPPKVQTRIDTYHEETEPMLEKLETNFNYKIFKVDGMSKPDAVKESINKIIAEHLR